MPTVVVNQKKSWIMWAEPGGLPPTLGWGGGFRWPRHRRRLAARPVRALALAHLSLRAKVQPGLVLVVAAASQLDVCLLMPAAACVRRPMVELEPQSVELVHVNLAFARVRSPTIAWAVFQPLSGAVPAERCECGFALASSGDDAADETRRALTCRRVGGLRRVGTALCKLSSRIAQRNETRSRPWDRVGNPSRSSSAGGGSRPGQGRDGLGARRPR